MALVSRIKEDIVLSKFDTIYGKKMLYSLQNREYYIIIQTGDYYDEYVVKTDSLCNILFFKKAENAKDSESLKTKKFLTRKKKKHLKQLDEDKQTLSDAFNTDQYSEGLTTSSPQATYIAGVPSYFVIKDENNRRFGEYCFSSITIPSPINPQLWAYLIRKLSENIK